MKAITKVLAGGVVAAALLSAAPAAAQYYPPSYGYGYNGGANVIGQVLNQVLGGSTYGYNQGYGYQQGYGYGANSQVAVNQCVNAVQARLSRSYSGYNYRGYGSARVLGISRVEPRSNGGLTIRGVASTGVQAGYGYNGQTVPDMTFRCRVDYRGYVSDVDLDRTSVNYGYNQPYQPYDYSQYGYRRY